jgi:hypothetical protein
VKDWVDVSVDSTVPATWGWGFPQPAFARPAGGEEWAMIIEKCIAKYCGSYAALNGGNTAWALHLLLGARLLKRRV